MGRRRTVGGERIKKVEGAGMRLIDADELKNNMDKGMQGTARDYLKFYQMAVDDQPTAYDIDKVVEQLEELQERHPYKIIGDYDTYSQYNQAWESCSEQAIEIVKGGAV